MSCRKGDRLSQSRLGYKLVVLVLPTCLFTVFILFFYLLLLSQSSPDQTDVGYMMMKDPSCSERTYDYAYANPVQVTNSLILILFYSFIYLLIYLFIFSNVHSLFPRKLTLDT